MMNFRRTALVATAVGGALALSACATTKQVNRAQSTADTALAQAQSAQASAQQANSAAQAAAAAAARAQATADQANSAAQAAAAAAQANTRRAGERG